MKVDADLTKNPVDYFSAGLVDDSNVFEWDITIIGPSDTILCAPVSLHDCCDLHSCT